MDDEEVRMRAAGVGMAVAVLAVAVAAYLLYGLLVALVVAGIGGWATWERLRP